MPTPRKPQKAAPRAAEPVTIDDTPALPVPVADLAESTALPALNETLEASLNKVVDLQEQFRQVTEESLEKSKRVYAHSREVAEDATASIGASFKAVTQGVTDLNVKTVEALQASADAQFAFVKALLATKSLSEIIALQGEHLRQQFETLNAAAKDVSNLIHKVSTESVEPIKSAISKSLKIAA
jgi:phasin